MSNATLLHGRAGTGATSAEQTEKVMRTKEMVNDQWHLSDEKLEAHLGLADATLAAWGRLNYGRLQILKGVEAIAKLLGESR